MFGLPRLLLRQSRRQHTATFEFAADTFSVHKCEQPPSTTTATRAEMLALYTNMVEVRRLETACDQAYKSKLIRGFCHLSTGQEAIAAGMEVVYLLTKVLISCKL